MTFNSTAPQPNPSQRRRVSILLLVGFSSPIFAYLWRGRFEYFDGTWLLATYLLTSCCLLFSILYFKEGRARIGLRLDNLGLALGRAALPTLGAAMLVLLFGLANGGPALGWSQLPWVYILWAAVQQIALQAFLLRRFQDVFPNPAAAVIAASLLFGLFHIPNLVLAILSLAGALLWCALFRRTPNLIANIASHALLGLLLALFFKNGQNQFQVGRPGLPYQTYGQGIQVAGGYGPEGRPFVATLPGHDRSTAPLVSIRSPDGELHHQWNAFPGMGYSANLSVGDLGFGPGDEIAVAPGPGMRNPEEVRIYDLEGRELSRFQVPGPEQGYGAYPYVSHGRVLVSRGPGPDYPAECFEFEPQGRLVHRWKLEGLPHRNSIRCGGLDPETYFAWGTFLSINPARVDFFDTSGATGRSWSVFPTTYGLSLSRIRLKDGSFGFVAAPGALLGHPPHIRVLSADGSEVSSLFPYRDDRACGSNVGALDVDGDGQDEILLGWGNCKGSPPEVRIIRLDGKEFRRWSR